MVGTLAQKVDDMAYIERSFLFMGPPQTNKTRACYALARRVMQEQLSLDGNDRPTPKHQRYGVFVRSLDSLKELRGAMRPFVPVILDEINVRNIGVRALDGDAVKTIVDLDDPGTLDCKNGDASFTKHQPRFMTTNRTLRDWLPMSVKMPGSWMQGDITEWVAEEGLAEEYNDLRAILRRITFVVMKKPILKEAACDAHDATVKALKARGKMAREMLQASRDSAE